MEFYKACLGGELSVMTVADSPMKDQSPAEIQDQVMHSQLAAGEIVLMASDTLGRGEVVRGNGTTLCIIGRTKAEIQDLFAKLSEGGSVGLPLLDAFFGTFGELTDKFGVNWMFQANPE
jgi:PhnB protein